MPIVKPFINGEVVDQIHGYDSPDRQWRVGQERVLPEDELDSDKGRGAL